jgi:hypothetical protein
MFLQMLKKGESEMVVSPNNPIKFHSPVNIRLKFWFFGNYWWILILVIATGLALLLLRNEPPATLVAFLGSNLSIFYFLQKQKLEELQLFRLLFKEFNERYEKINIDLGFIAESKSIELSQEEISILISYFNLCGEEYFYFSKGYIDPSVWMAWFNGMKSLLESKRIYAFWSKEKKLNSYYNLPL